ncbi:MAG: ABC transporter permease [Caldilineaceae bacterium]|nr:ABC transporter permease [Caldilineaceae bacterium]
MAFYLSIKEIMHNKGRFLLISLIVALITTLILFIAALAEGLGAGNREYLEKLGGELVVYQSGVDLSISASRIGRNRANAMRRVEGVEDVGQVGISSATILFEDPAGKSQQLDISLIGVEPGRPGEPPAYAGLGLGRDRANEVVIGGHVAERTGLQVGDSVQVKSVQGTEEELYELEIVGISDGQQFFLRPSIFLPYLTWEKVRPQGSGELSRGELVSNIVNVKLADGVDMEIVAQRIVQQVGDIEAVDRETAYKTTPGYSAQQSTLDTQRYFTFFIGLLVIGGFFQIQTLQKVAQIGMLKAIGASTFVVAMAAITQIVTINAFGVLLGAAGSLALSLTFPPSVPIVFTGDAVASAIIALLLIGPLGGLVSVWLLLRVEPLTALGLAQ